MALDAAALEDALLKGYLDMKDAKSADEANDLFVSTTMSAIADYVNAGETETKTYAGAATPPTVVVVPGQVTGKGAVTVQSSIGEAALTPVIAAMKPTGDDSLLSAFLAQACTAMCTPSMVDEDLSGQGIDSSSGSPIPVSGKAMGTMVAVFAPLQAALDGIFANMGNMDKDINEYLAAEMAKEIDGIVSKAVTGTMTSIPPNMLVGAGGTVS